MSPADTVNPAWPAVPPADGLPGRVAAEIAPAAEKAGFVPDAARLREAGFSDADIPHTVEVTAIFDCNVRPATATGLFPSAGYRAPGRTARKEG